MFEVIVAFLIVGTIVGSIPAFVILGPPWRWFSSELTNEEFRNMLVLILQDPNLSLDRFNLEGAGYKIWITNRYYGFNVNEVTNFSVYQKYLTYKCVDTLNARVKEHNLKGALKKHQLSSTGRVLYGPK